MRKLETLFKKRPRIIRTIFTSDISLEEGILSDYTLYNPLNAVVSLNTSSNKVEVTFPVDIFEDFAHAHMTNMRVAIDAAGYNYTAKISSSTSERNKVAVAFHQDSSPLTKLDIDGPTVLTSFRLFIYSDIL